MRGAILAGGHATRFGGRPKGLERVGGRRIVDRVAEAVAAVVDAPPLLIANAPDARTWDTGLSVMPDRQPGLGTLGGIHTAVTAGDGPVVLVAWDMPFVPVSLLSALVDGAGAHDVFLPASDSRRGFEPLCGVYGPACAAPIERALAAGDYRAMAFHPEVRVGLVPLADLGAHGDPAWLFFNVNTAADLARAEHRWRTLG